MVRTGSTGRICRLGRASLAAAALVTPLVLVAPGWTSAPPTSVATTEKWGRHVVTLPDASPVGNPFEVILDVTFTHVLTGTRLTLPGYYAGNLEWKVGFMPTLTGKWDWVSSSPDPDLDGIRGSLLCVESSRPGMLTADPDHPRKWKYSDGDLAVPMAFRMEFFYEPATTAEFTAAADFLQQTVHGHLYETRLLDEKGWFGGRHDWIFAGNWADHRFDLAVWDRMEERMEILASRGLGAHVMLYSDDGGTPGWAGRSPTEALVVRYVVARLAGYPVVWFNTGIDIAEYRSQADIDWLCAQFRALDPYDHPISSRRGGGSGNIVMQGRTFESDGLSTASIDPMLQTFSGSSRPVSFDDAWGENRPSHPTKNHTPADIRRAFWKCVVAGGTGGLVRGGGDGLPDDGYFSILHIAQDLESEQWLSLIAPFVRDRLGSTFGDMVPAAALVSGNAYCLADPARQRLLYLSLGVNDTYDPGSGPFVARLSGQTGSWSAAWFDPRTGVETPVGTLRGGADRTLTPPSSDDWVLLLESLTPGRSLGGGAMGQLLLESAPNPFRETTRVSFVIPGERSVPVRVSVHDAAGRLVAVLDEGERTPGTATVSWSGRDSRGRSVAPGVYFCRLETPDVHRVRKLLLVH